MTDHLLDNRRPAIRCLLKRGFEIGQRGVIILRGGGGHAALKKQIGIRAPIGLSVVKAVLYLN
jgi:hypothetical protein